VCRRVKAVEDLRSFPAIVPKDPAVRIIAEVNQDLCDDVLAPQAPLENPGVTVGVQGSSERHKASARSCVDRAPGVLSGAIGRSNLISITASTPWRPTPTTRRLGPWSGSDFLLRGDSRRERILVTRIRLRSRILPSLVIPVLVAGWVLPAWADSDSALRVELQAYYQNPESDRPPVINAALEQLDSDDRQEGEKGAAILVAALQMLLDDEATHPGRVVQTPYWGVGAERKESSARALRSSIMDVVISYFPRDHVFLPVLSWVLRHETIEESLKDAVIVLHDIPGDQATSIFVEVVEKGSAPSAVLVSAMSNVIERDPDKAAVLLRRYANHRDPAVRETARAFLSGRGETLAPFDSAAALAPLKEVLQQVVELLPEPITSAPFVSIRYREKNPYGGESIERVTRGFELPAADPSTYRLLTVFLEYVVIERTTPLLGDDRREIPVEEEVARVESIRARVNAGDDDAADELSEDGGLTGQFQPRSISGYEILLAAELLERGDAARAARVLLPPLGTLGRDDSLLPIVRSQLGTQLTHGMLELFVGERDYPAALRRAQQITSRFGASADGSIASVLAEQLPNRLDEFVTFRMPTEEEWKSLSKGLTRKQQIDYLCDHIRILNAFQAGQPGGVDFDGPQYAEPSGLIDAAWSGDRGKTEVLNPLVALDALDLNIADIEVLAPHLLDERVLPTVGFWRDFSPRRETYRVAEIVSWKIDAVAHEKVAHLKELASLDKAGKAAAVARIVEWSRANSGMSRKEKILDLVSKAAEWKDINYSLMREIRELHLVEALPLLFRFLDQPDTNDRVRMDILRQCADVDGEKTAKVATRYLESGDSGLRLYAAVLAMKGTDRDRARTVLRDGIENATSIGSDNQIGAAVYALLHTGDATDFEAAKSILEKPFMKGADLIYRSNVVCMFRDHLELVARFYLPMFPPEFDPSGPAVSSDDGKTSWKTPKLVWEVLQCLWDRIELQWPHSGNPDEEAQAYEALLFWLSETAEGRTPQPAAAGLPPASPSLPGQPGQAGM